MRILSLSFCLYVYHSAFIFIILSLSLLHLLFLVIASKSEEEVICNGVGGKRCVKSEEEKEAKKSPVLLPLPFINGDVSHDDDDLDVFVEKTLPKKHTNVAQCDENVDSCVRELHLKVSKHTNGTVVTGVIASSPSVSVSLSASSSLPVRSLSSKPLNTTKDNGSRKSRNSWREQLSASNHSLGNSKDEHISR